MADFHSLVRAKLMDCGLEPTREAEIVDEVSQHLRDRYEMYISSGESVQEAERIVTAEFSQRDLAQELRRTERRWAEPVAPGWQKSGFWSGLSQDLRYTTRVLRMNPAFTAVCVLSLRNWKRASSPSRRCTPGSCGVRSR